MQPTLLHHQLTNTVAGEDRAGDAVRLPAEPRVRPVVARALRALATRLEPVAPAPGIVAKPPQRAHRPRVIHVRRPVCRPARRVRAVGRQRGADGP